MIANIHEEHARLLRRLGSLTKAFAARADGYDRTASFPKEDFDDLFAAGLHAPTAPREYGGLGLGPLQGNTYVLWRMTRLLATADLSLARCWEGHANSMVLLDAMASSGQKERWFRGVVERGETWVAWSGEPKPGKGETRRIGTHVRREGDDWIVDGTKIFATSANGANWAILLVDSAGPGGARHSESPETVFMLACDLSDPSISVDGSWWDPIGMRATVSHLVRFHQTRIPDANRIGEPGAYMREGWQTAFIPHYAASFLGAAEAAYREALQYIAQQDKSSDPYVQQRVGAMSVAVETADLWLQHVADLWDRGPRAEAQLAGSRARHVVEHLALQTVEHCIRACGARCLIRPSPVERILRDLSFYVRHDNDDHILATIGRARLGKAHDLSFYKP
ncbi:acyl-CoA dehydrogenase family protein [Pendulispora albinea]|uniref:Acyl-CoA/acyl-ACP dehydrogenase n=1 Tax=Pendulispora albinea TaxID=2741071 RepID=A0ABZ2MBJ2_9BACT